MERPVMSTTLRTVATIAVCLAALSADAATHRCANDARQRAEKLLRLHAETTQPISIDKDVKTIAPIRNPADAKQQFDVLAINGFVYKAQYRMRFIYAQIEGTCALIGQEILEHTRL
jgi:hypothetical protein